MATSGMSQSTLCSTYTPMQNQFEDIPDGTTVSSLGITSWENKKLRIHGTLIIDQDFQINNSALWLVPENNVAARIILQDDAWLYSFNTDYFCCSFRWQGFIVKDNSWLALLDNNIEDASLAVDIQSATSQAGIGYNTFNRNLQSIVADGINVNAWIGKNTFQSTSQINGGAVMPQNAIKFLNCPVATVGDANPIFKNNISDHFRGLNLSNSTVTVHNTDFSNNTYGIDAKVSNLTVSGYQAPNGGAITRSLFKQNKQRDINALSTNLSVSYCEFRECGAFNINSVGNKNLEQINISRNIFDIADSDTSIIDSKTAIYLDRSTGGLPSSTLNIIRDNEITIHDFYLDKRAGIKVNGFAGSNDNMLINLNRIFLHRGGSDMYVAPGMDITLDGALNFLLNDNEVQLFNTKSNGGNNRWGIYLHDGNFGLLGRNQLIRNHVHSGSSEFDNGCCAIHCTDAGPLFVCNNKTNNTLRGFHFTGNCGASYLFLNKIKNHAYLDNDDFGVGLLVQKSFWNAGYVGSQYCGRNHWETADYSPGYGARFTGYLLAPPDQDDILKSIFYVKKSFSLQLPNPIEANGIEWFRNENCPTEGSESCTISTSNPFDGLDDRELYVADEHQDADSIEVANEWEDKRQLLVKLMSNPALIETNTAVTNFYNTQIATSAGLFARFDSMFRAVMLADPELATDALESDSLLKIAQGRLDSLDATIADSIGFANLTLVFFQYRRTLLTNIALHSTQSATLRQQIQQEKMAGLADCSTFNDALRDEYPFETNQKDINSIQIKYASGDTLEETHLQTLRSIADQCLELSGKTHSRAVNLLPFEEYVTYLRDMPESGACDSLEERARKSMLSPLHYRLSPNPSNGFVVVSYDNLFNGDIYITDIAGRIVSRQTNLSEAKSVTIDLSAQPAGLYIIRMRDVANNRSTTGKFSIVK